MEKTNLQPLDLDITGDICPLTFVKTKLKLEQMASGQVLIIRLNSGEPLLNVPRSLQEQGYTILKTEAENPEQPEKTYKIWILRP